MKATTIGIDSDYITFIVTTTTSHIRVVVIGANNNNSPNKFITLIKIQEKQ
jgi:hypothetical protein